MCLFARLSYTREKRKPIKKYDTKSCEKIAKPIVELFSIWQFFEKKALRKTCKKQLNAAQTQPKRSLNAPLGHSKAFTIQAHAELLDIFLMSSSIHFLLILPPNARTSQAKPSRVPVENEHIAIPIKAFA